MNTPVQMPRPVRDRIYTYAEIQTLYLQDSPFLMVSINGTMWPVQEDEKFDAVRQAPDIEGFMDTQWKYIRTTEEWIPIFHYAGERPIETFVTIEPDTESSDFRDNKGKLWVCFKGYRQPQYGEE